MSTPQKIHRRTIAVMARALDQQDGLGIYAHNVLRQLLMQDPGTRYVILLGSSLNQHEFRGFPNAETHVLRARSKLMWDQILVARAARHYGADLIFNPKFSLPLLSGLPGVFVLQSCDWYVNPGNYPWWDTAYMRLSLPLYCRKARRLLAISGSTLDELRRRLRIDLKRTAVTYAGVGPNFTPRVDCEAQQEFRRQYRLPERFMLTVARVQHTGHNGLPDYPGGNNERLIHAYRQYRRDSTEPIALVVAGRDVDTYLRARGFTADDLQGVQFLGFVPNDRIHLAFQLAECFVLATLCESFGIPILEAMATGCPAIVPATGAGPEVSSGAARLIDPYDVGGIAQALREMTGSPQLRAQLRQRGLERAAAFSWPRTAEHILETFDEICPVGAVSPKPRTASDARRATAG